MTVSDNWTTVNVEKVRFFACVSKKVMKMRDIKKLCEYTFEQVINKHRIFKRLCKIEGHNIT